MGALLALGTGSHSCTHCYMLPLLHRRSRTLWHPPCPPCQLLAPPRCPAPLQPSSCYAAAAQPARGVALGQRVGRRCSCPSHEPSTSAALLSSSRQQRVSLVQGLCGGQPCQPAVVHVSGAHHCLATTTAGNKPCAHRPKPSNSSASCICVLHMCVRHSTWSTGSGCC
jgi:hypothetical protein